jgi:predicted nucleotidyltransferase
LAVAEDLVATAREFVVERFPDAKAAYLAGSVAAGRATASSDLDIVVVQGSDDAETFREALRRGGRLVELFAHTAATYREFWDADVASRRCTMPQMYAGGIILVSRNGFAQARQAEAARLVEAGPPALGPEALETMRYLLTDALDDLADLTDPIEVAACAAGVLEMAADLVCARAGWWVGRGKWLPRRLLEADPDQGGRLLRGFTGDRALLLEAARDVLDGVGGPLREGYRRTWRGVIESDALRVR